MSKSSLKLFGVVPDLHRKGNPALIEEYGYVVSDLASYDLTNIRAWLKETGVGDAERNSAFWQDWQKIRQMSDFQMRLEQILHYFSTYGLEWITGQNPVEEGWVFIPASVFHYQNGIKLKVIYAVSPAYLIERCFGLLNSGMALSQETIQDVIAVLRECDYRITGEEQIANREAAILFYDASGSIPVESSMLFRYLIYHFTGSSMVVNDEKTKELVVTSGKILPYIDPRREISLAQSFNRYKDLWLAIKSANRLNHAKVNRISKLSKIHHKPMPDVVMNNLTSKIYSIEQVREAASRSTIFQIVRAINAMRLNDSHPKAGVYKIRNGRVWTKLSDLFKPKTLLQLKDAASYQSILLTELRNRFKDVVAYTEDFVDFAFPVSEKSYVGNVPEGSILRFSKNDELLLVGVHWKNPETDLDLRAESANFSVGWNTNFRTGDRGLMHSGDMTRAPAPYGASEWLYCKNIGTAYNIKLNIFRAGPRYDNTVKFMIGRSTDVPKMNYRIAPEKILISYVVKLEDRQTSLGTIYDDKDNVYFLLGTGTTGKGHVGRWSKYDSAQQDVAFKKISSALRLSDVIRFTDNPEKATVNLSLETLTKDSFLKILK